jgi:hypothetical protein
MDSDTLLWWVRQAVQFMRCPSRDLIISPFFPRAFKFYQGTLAYEQTSARHHQLNSFFALPWFALVGIQQHALIESEVVNVFDHFTCSTSAYSCLSNSVSVGVREKFFYFYCTFFDGFGPFWLMLSSQSLNLTRS